MQELVEITKSVGAMPPGVLGWVVVLAAFGLAAFAIHAVVTLARGGRR